jgi:signal transduction histidine kinase
LTAQGSYFAELNTRKLFLKKRQAHDIYAALMDQKELYELVFSNTQSGVLIIDVEANRFIDCNEPAVNMLKYEHKEALLNQRPADISPEFQSDGQRSNLKSDEMNAIAIEKGSHSFEWEHLDANNDKVWVEIILTPIMLDGKKVLHVVWKNIDDKKRAEAELKEKQVLLIHQARFASMGEMIGNISHQWRQPLNALGLVIQKLSVYHKKGLLDDNKLRETVDKSVNLINVMSHTIDSFREFFSPNKEKTLFMISDAIEKAHAIIDESLEYEDIQYSMEISDATLSFKGYENEFSQVIINLLKNSKDELIEHKISPAYITVKVYTQDDYIFVDIMDNAGGIKSGVIDKVFEPYFTTKEEGKGTGIGLYMSKTIIEEHMQGTLSVHNTEEGACFSIQLPL